jgi:plastocyanin
MPKFYALSAILLLAVGLLLRAQDGQNPRTTALIRGTIAFQGTLPLAPVTRMAGDPYCAALAPAAQAQLDDVIIYAQPIAPTSFPVPPTSVVLDRRECKYIPHTLTIQVGQKLILRNSDGTAHNAHGWPRINMSFNVSLPRQGTESVQILQKEELPFPIRDDVHNWEVAYIGVFSHPYHTVSKLNGVYEFTLPSGAYEIGVWHEKLGTQTQSLGARPGDVRELNFVFK